MKRAKIEREGAPPVWLVTFSDVMTLLMTFLVLILSMSSMDAATLARISSYSGDVSKLEAEDAGRVPERIEIIVELIKDPQSLMEKTRMIKDLLFPNDALPPEINRSTLEKNLEILAHPEGVVIVLTDALLFSGNSPSLDAKGEMLIDSITPVIFQVNSDVNISGHTDDLPAAGISKDDLSALRALSVLERFLHGGVRPDRFSISGYGGDKPMYSNATEDGRRKNNRVEILVKTTPRMGGYIN